MSLFRSHIYSLTRWLEHSFDRFKIWGVFKSGGKLSVGISPYISFGNEKEFYVSGRVLHLRNIVTSNNDSTLSNIANMYKRFNSHEVKGAKLRLVFGDIEKEFLTDEDGYFHETINPSTPLELNKQWIFAEIELVSSPIPFIPPVKAKSKILFPSSSVSFGIISDIDDTIIKTNAASVVKMLYKTIVNNAHSRLPFQGVAAFYRALSRGISGNEKNPFFYVSSSPWNLYDMLIDFMAIQGIPEGPLLLKDYGFSHNKIISENHQLHKLRQIKILLETYPLTKFILIGDSGQQDPEIYTQVVREFPDRILAIYIRDVTLEKRDREIRNIILQEGVPVIYSENTYDIAVHAINCGWMPSEMLSAIITGLEEDMGIDE